MGWRRVYRFDGENWSQHNVIIRRPDAAARWGGVLLALSPDGKTAVACATGGPLSLWREGKWSRLELTAPLESPPAEPSANPPPEFGIVGLALPDSAGLWCLLDTGELRHITLTGGKLSVNSDDGDRVKLLIKSLADDDFTTRERATGQLTAMGSAIISQLEKAQGESTDPEQQFRLKLILQRIARRAAKRPRSPFGAVHVGEVRQLARDERGRVFIVAGQIEDHNGNAGAGVAMLSPDGAATVVYANEPAAAEQRFYSAAYMPPILTAGGTRLWVATGIGLPTLRLLDLQRRQVLDTLPSNIRLLHAVDKDGRVFVFPDRNRGQAPPIKVYFRPEARKER